MFLSADQVRFGQPRTKVRVDVTPAAQPEDMHVITRRKRLDAPEPGMVEPPREHDMPVDPRAPRGHLRERHPHLKGNSRPFRENPNRSDRADGGDDLIEERANLRRLATKVWRERIPAA